MVILGRGEPPAPSGGNLLLASLSESARARLDRYLIHVPLTLEQRVGRQGHPIDRVYFPDSGVISLLAVTEEGKSVGVAIVGNEGVVGVHAIYAGAIMPCDASVQVAGTARVMKASDLRREICDGGELAEILGRYSQALLMQGMQTGACSRSHSIKQRAARWILAIHERVGQGRFRLTQERLALILGVRRPTVSLVACDFQRAGLIDYRHGRMTILDRRRLEAASCECNRVAQEHFARLVPSRREQKPQTSPFNPLLALA